MPVDLAAVAQHGIGRGDFAVLVFSGPTDVLGEVIGQATWSTPRKFVLRDPRKNDGDLAERASCPFRRWSADDVRPTPGVCFVFADSGHPGIAEMRTRGGVEWEDFVSLDRLTVDALLERRVDRFLSDVKKGAPAYVPMVGLLGYGAQGERAASMLGRMGLPSERVLVVDTRPERAQAARDHGYEVVELTDARLEIHDPGRGGVRRGAAIISSSQNRPGVFDEAVSMARLARRPVLDLSLPWDDRPEFRQVAKDPDIWMTGAAERAIRIDGSRLIARDPEQRISVSIARLVRRRIRRGSFPHVLSGQRADLREPFDVYETTPTDHLPAHFGGSLKTFIGLDAQSNQHDAAMGVFAARDYLERCLSEHVRSLIPAEHRAALGATAFERVLARSVTGRTLGAPYLTPVEQTALGMLARAYANDSPIVEIGSALGGSAVLMAAATAREDGSGPVIISVDPDQETRLAMRAVCELEGCAPRVKMIVKTSDDAVADVIAELKLWQDAHGDRIGGAGLIFIDGLHTQEQSRRDFENYAPLVRPGGVLLFHDFDARFAGVAMTIADIVGKDPRFMPLCIMDTIAVFERQ